MEMLIEVLESDIDKKRAYNAHINTSFTPDVRAEQEVKGYVSFMTAVVTEFSGYATEENKAEVKAELERFKAGYIQRLYAELDASSRTMSAMITGPSNFPVRSNEKKLNTAHKRLEELLDYSEKVQAKMKRQFDPRALAHAPIMADDPNAIEKLQAQVDILIANQEKMKLINKIVLNKKTTDEQKMQAMIDAGIGERLRNEALTYYMGRRGIQPFTLTNNNADIKRKQARIEQLKREAARPEVEDREVAGGITVVENTDEVRLQVFFPGKPNQAVRELMKSNGFRFAPSQGNAWQRLLNDNARVAWRRIEGKIVELSGESA